MTGQLWRYPPSLFSQKITWNKLLIALVKSSNDNSDKTFFTKSIATCIMLPLALSTFSKSISLIAFEIVSPIFFTQFRPIYCIKKVSIVMESAFTKFVIAETTASQWRLSTKAFSTLQAFSPR